MNFEKHQSWGYANSWRTHIQLEISQRLFTTYNYMHPSPNRAATLCKMCLNHTKPAGPTSYHVEYLGHSGPIFNLELISVHLCSCRAFRQKKQTWIKMVKVIKNCNNVSKTRINHPEFHHFYRWYVYHSQSWVVSLWHCFAHAGRNFMVLGLVLGWILVWIRHCTSTLMGQYSCLAG
jgi:hypothetical protein